MGNYSKDPQTALQEALQKNYARVRFQQGKPVLDRELNLLGDLASPQRLAAQFLGNGVPIGDNGFLISGLDVGNHDFTIGAGRCLVDGREVVLATAATYKTQPHPENVAALPAGTSNIYLRVFTSEVNSAQDADLQNAGDVGFETAVREKVEWEVLVTTATITSSDHFLLAVIDTAAATVQDRRRTGLTLATVADEISAARGSTGQLRARLDTSLTPAGTLQPGAVDTNALANQAVTQGKIATQAVAIAQLKQNVVFDGSVSIGPNAETAINLISGKRHAHLLISVFVSGTSAGVNAAANVTWTDFFSQITFFGFTIVRRGIQIKNNNTATTVTVQVQANELLAS